MIFSRPGAGRALLAGLLLAALGCAARTPSAKRGAIGETTERPEQPAASLPDTLPEPVPVPAAAPTPSRAATTRAEPVAPSVSDPVAPVLLAEYPGTLASRRQVLIERGLGLGAGDVGYYMDVQEARLRQAGRTALRLTRRGASVVMEMPGRLAFEIGSARLSAGAVTALSDVATVLVDYRLTIVSIEGHTDDSGDAVQNRALSEQRAAAVARVLLGKGVDSERLVVVGYGSERPVADNTTEVGREANRRVVLRVEPLQR